jgi:hypothetical protein
VASAKLVKQTKKVASSPAVAPAVARVSHGASGSKGAAGGTKKTMSLAQNLSVPASRMLAEASSAKSHESLPHDQLLRDPVPEAVSRPECEASLQISPATGIVVFRFWALLLLSP